MSFLNLISELYERQSAENDIQFLERWGLASGVLVEGEQLLSITEDSPWARGGSETFVCHVSWLVESTEGSRLLRMIAKAYAGFGLGVDPEIRVRQWADRAAALSDGGCHVPRIYSTDKAVLICDYVGVDLFKAFRDTEIPATDLREEVRSCVANLERLEACPTALLTDARWESGLMYLVDFGEDLGSIPNSSYKPGCVWLLAQRELGLMGLSL